MDQATARLHSSAAYAGRIRRRVLEMICRAKSSHIGSVFSAVDVLAVLYDKILRVDPARPEWPDRDRFVLSKGHACAGLYAALAERGFFPEAWLDEFFANGGRLAGHATHWGVPGVEVSTGSLGHGLSLGCGMALAGKRDRLSYRVFVMLSDGECDEGSTWEASLFAPHHRLDNLVAIVDYNKIQSFGRVGDVLDLGPFGAKWESFGWSVNEIDGHDHEQIEQALRRLPRADGKPTCVIANTVKGKGVSFMEDQILWHYRCPDADEQLRALGELEGK
ncbi:MAG TPA: transketolase [Candidatus Acidoferrales bacterium]|jgi:transketolase|nr:transketolase [Candidatus Acidoferrales bacterium]